MAKRADWEDPEVTSSQRHTTLQHLQLSMRTVSKLAEEGNTTRRVGGEEIQYGQDSYSWAGNSQMGG